MIRREPTRRRTRPFRSARRIILVIIGAEKTETGYLKGLRGHLQLSNVAMKVVEKPGSPLQLVEYARASFSLDDFDEVWCVTDVDHYEREGGKVTAALAAAAKAGISLAVSNPCFELWLLLHHEECRGHCPHCGAVTRRLQKRVPEYNKTRLRFADFANGVESAIERAKALEPTGTDHLRNPSTNVWRLVNVMRGDQ